MYCSVRIFNLHSVFRICQEISIRDRLDGVGGGRINGGHSEGATGPRHPNARKTSFLILLKLTNLDPFRKIVDQICLVFLFLGYPTLGPGSLDPVCLARPLLSLLPPPPRRGNPVTAHGGGQILGFSWRTPQRCRYRRETLHASNNLTSTKCWTISLKKLSYSNIINQRSCKIFLKMIGKCMKNHKNRGL